MKDRITRFNRRTLITGAGRLGLGAVAVSALASTTTGRRVARAQRGDEIIVSAQQFSQEPLQPFIAEFTKQTGIMVSFFANPSAGGDQVAQLTPQFASSSTPVDVLSSSDEAAPLFIRAGWMEPLNDIIPDGFWDDWDQSVRDYVAIWSTVDDQVYRIPHGWSVGYFWTRQDLLTQMGAQAPASWDDIRALGETAKAQGKFAFADAASKPSLAFVYAAYVVAQAGGDIFAFDDGTRAAFAFARELVDKEYFPKAAANWTYDQLNAAYMNDSLVTMRQWPFFYDVSRRNTAWFTDEKAVITLPPAGPGGIRATWAGAWGWMIPKFTEKKDAAKEYIKFMTAPERSGPLAQAMSDYITPRKSALAVLKGQGLAKSLAEYSAAGVITPRPFHPRVSEAQAIIDTVFNGYLTGQLNLDDAMSNGKRDIDALSA